MQEPFCYLTTKGRRSGRPHTVEMWFAASDSSRTLYLMSGGRDRSDWVRNIIAAPEVEVRVGQTTYAARGRILEDGTPEDATARRLVLAKYEHEEDLDDWGRTALAVALDLL